MKPLVFDLTDAECYITKGELFRAAIGHLFRLRVFNARLCLKSIWSARWR
jgi:hypothetical protein